MNICGKYRSANRIVALATLLAIGTIDAPEIAQARQVKQSKQSGTEAQRRACTPDVWRLCSAYIPFEGPITACLMRNDQKRKLSHACHLVFLGKI
jgi:hypothetical protein